MKLKILNEHAIQSVTHDPAPGKKVRGLVIYRGPSALDHEPIVAIATGLHGESHNPKTGPMAQIFIMREDLDPIEAIETGEDESVCGTCPHRGTSCYVQVSHSVLGVYRAYHRGSYTEAKPEHLELFRGRKVRFGAYGEPVAFGFEIAQSIVSVAAGWTGYTHAFRTCDQRWKSILMASCDSVKDYEEARKLGWRTFRVRQANEPLLPREMSCPAAKEAGHRLTCEECLVCRGNPWGSTTKGNVSIIVHGSPVKLRMFEKLQRS